ncbi:MAG: tRNA (guanosine(46)-N7)-methyltransferase TrmB [Verrucomicrobiales bacterium]|nr:tRNA (guanosine(46)-N7)-methyltransferase TrmB [Verrucomicrobiales bacterium]
MSNLKRNGLRRWAPSYLRNQGKVTKAQKRALREWWNEFGLRFEYNKTLDLNAAFPIDGPLVIEIGFGKGDHLIELAQSFPEHRFLGIEVHRPGLAHATALAKEHDCRNVRLLRGDARLILTDHLEPEIASAVMIQFPDPWPKPGDRHRRLLQPGMLDTLYRTLRSGGELLLVTDVEDYAQDSERNLQEAEGWERQISSPWFDHRIETLYESKAREAGRAIHEIAYRRR